jgi:N-acetylmuramoyl-L-alanine amidase
MKYIFKAFLIMLLSFAICIPMQTIVKASTFTNMDDKKDVVASKPWTVNFSKALSSTTVNTTNIKVLSEDNDYIDIDVSLVNNNKSILVKPIENYKNDTTYTLIVTQNVKSYDGEALDSEIRMNFTTTNTTKKNYSVVLDAGHGGNDPGAIGPTGIKEKNIALAVTLKVGDILKKNNVETIYTRENDNITWPNDDAQNLQARSDISNTAEPDYFVSIHMNSFDNPSVNGIETYYFTGNTYGQALAQAVQTELIKATGGADRGIKTSSGLWVLKHTDAVAILVEPLFISNIAAEKLVATEEYQQKLAKAIATGILKSFGIGNIVYF